MKTLRNAGRGSALEGLNAAVIWLTLAFVLGLHYRIVAASQGYPWPLPTPVALGGVFFHRSLSVSLQAPYDTILWLAAFPLAGTIWVWLLHLTAPRYGARTPGASATASRLAFTALPLMALAFFLVYLAGQGFSGWSIRQVFAVLLGQRFVSGPGWLQPLATGLAVVSLGLHLYVYARRFALNWHSAWRHLTTVAVLYLLTLVGLAGVASVVLRSLF